MNDIWLPKGIGEWLFFLEARWVTWLFLNDPPSMNELLYVAKIQEYGAMYGSFIGIISDLWRQNIIWVVPKMVVPPNHPFQ